jgi:uncharacterized protein (DUF302 family)
VTPLKLSASWRRPEEDGDVIVTRSASGYAATAERLIEAIDDKGLTVFARIDHAAAAREAGMELAAEEVVLFGSPRAGTPLMQTDPRVGVELPLRILIWESGEGAMLGHRDPRELSREYDLEPHDQTLERMAALLDELVNAAAA